MRRERCSICNELVTTKNDGQFFPEDDSHICGACKREHQKSLEKIKSHATRKSYVMKSPNTGELKYAVGGRLEAQPN